MNGVNDDEIERLANRMAMLVSDDGEADNAGRAVGALARRLGLSGGQLKAIFMAGADSAAASARTFQQAEQAARIARLEAEIASLNETLRKTEAASRSLVRERDALHSETEELHEALDQRRSARQAKLAVGLIAVIAVIGAGWLVRSGPRLRIASDVPDQQSGSPFYHTAVIRDRSVPMHREPEDSSASVATLAIGTRLTVRRTLWHNLQQWVEVEVGGQTGYVLSTDVDLS